MIFVGCLKDVALVLDARVDGSDMRVWTSQLTAKLRRVLQGTCITCEGHEAFKRLRENGRVTHSFTCPP